MEYNFKDLINGKENLPKELVENKYVLYRIHNSVNNKNYIGTAKDGMAERLYNEDYGHVTYYRSRNSYKCRGMYSDMNEDINAFTLIIEYEEYKIEGSSYDTALDMETEYIVKYDSVLNGYNVSYDGKPGWKENLVCVNDGIRNLYIRPSDLIRFLSNGYKLGRYEAKDNNYFLKGRIFVTNGKKDRMIFPKDLEKYMKKGFRIGRINSPNKNKVWKNNGIKSKLINPNDLYKFPDFIYDGRIEPARKPRGPYNKEKKKKVNNGVIEKGIPISELDKFLEENSEFSIGRLSKGSIIVTNDETEITKYISPNELNEFKSNGFRCGRKRNK